MSNIYEYTINERLSINSFDLPIHHDDAIVLKRSLYNIIRGKYSSFYITLSNGYEVHVDKNIAFFDGKGYNISIHNKKGTLLFELKNIPFGELRSIIAAML